MKLGLIHSQIIFAIAIAFVFSGFANAQRKFTPLAPSVETATPKKPKFEDLLESKDLTKFRGYTTEEIGPGWSIKGKEVVFDGTGEGDLITVETFKDFELQVEWSVSKEGGNSGIMFRVTLGDEQPYMSGPEFQILDDKNAKDGATELTSAGALYGLYPATGEKVVHSVGKWNKSRIIVQGDKIIHYLNGKKVVEAMSGSADWNEKLANSKFKDWEKFNKSDEGHIAFQNHGDPVKFRLIRVKRLESGDAPEAEDNPSAEAENPVEGQVPPGAGRRPSAIGPTQKDKGK